SRNHTPKSLQSSSRSSPRTARPASESASTARTSVPSLTSSSTPVINKPPLLNLSLNHNTVLPNNNSNSTITMFSSNNSNNNSSKLRTTHTCNLLATLRVWVITMVSTAASRCT
ncbi:hypothetical protein BGZ89_007358, partial [Linnemannia elongata]